MKYVSFLNNKKESFGILLDQKIVDLTMHYEQYRQGMEWIPCLKSAIEDNKISDLNYLDLNNTNSNKLLVRIEKRKEQ